MILKTLSKTTKEVTTDYTLSVYKELGKWISSNRYSVHKDSHLFWRLCFSPLKGRFKEQQFQAYVSPWEQHKDKGQLLDVWPVLDLMLWCCPLDILNSFLTRGPTFLFHHGSHRFCKWRLARDRGTDSALVYHQDVNEQQPFSIAVFSHSPLMFLL